MDYESRERQRTESHGISLRLLPYNNYSSHFRSMDEEPSLLPRLAVSREKSLKWTIPCRYTLAILSCLGLCVAYTLRVSLSVALVAMVNSTYADANADSNNPECHKAHRNTTQTNSGENGEFNWNQKTQGIILGSFFYGYIITQMPGGWLASRFGAKHLFGFGVLSSSVFTLLTPWAAHYSVNMLIALRILEGLVQGMMYPCIYNLFSWWAPPLESSRLLTISLTGALLGTIISLPLSGFLCQSSFAGGWPSVFYLFGSVGILWFLFWIFLAYDRPSNHPRITAEEKEYILSSIGSSQDKELHKRKIPWLAICTSPAVWALNVTYFCSCWGYYTFLTTLPSYFEEVLDFKILKNGVFSAIPYTCQYIVTIVIGQLADWLRISKTITTIEVRKIFTCGAFVITACLLVSLSYTGCNDTTLAVILLTLAISCGGFESSGHWISHLDFAPRYAGVLFGIGNMFATIPGFAGPYVVGYLTNDKPTRGQWQKVFYITAGLYVIGALVFLVFGTAVEQPWNTPRDEVQIQEDIPREPTTGNTLKRDEKEYRNQIYD